MPEVLAPSKLPRYSPHSEAETVLKSPGCPNLPGSPALSETWVPKVFVAGISLAQQELRNAHYIASRYSARIPLQSSLQSPMRSAVTDKEVMLPDACENNLSSTAVEHVRAFKINATKEQLVLQAMARVSLAPTSEGKTLVPEALTSRGLLALEERSVDALQQHKVAATNALAHEQHRRSRLQMLLQCRVHRKLLEVRCSVEQARTKLNQVSAAQARVIQHEQTRLESARLLQAHLVLHLEEQSRHSGGALRGNQELRNPQQADASIFSCRSLVRFERSQVQWLRIAAALAHVEVAGNQRRRLIAAAEARAEDEKRRSIERIHGIYRPQIPFLRTAYVRQWHHCTAAGASSLAKLLHWHQAMAYVLGPNGPQPGCDVEAILEATLPLLLLLCKPRQRQMQAEQWQRAYVQLNAAADEQLQPTIAAVNMYKVYTHELQSQRRQHILSCMGWE